jgi:hypothetical protein
MATMTATQGHDLDLLESRLRGVDQGMKSLAAGGLSELITIIRRPGWTTPAEFALVMGIVESLQAHANVMAGLQKSLVAAARSVGNA